MRKEKKYQYIYKTVNILSGKYYIGMHSTDDLDDGYLGSGKRLRYSINKHGKDNHVVEILEYCNSREELKKREEEIVNLNEIAKIDCMNLKVGGYGGFSSEAHRIKFMESYNYESSHQRIKWLRNNDAKWVDDFNTKRNTGINNYYKNHSSTFKGKIHSDETKFKISESSKGNGIGPTNSQYGKCWITNEKESKKIYLGDEIPEGWRLGRKMNTTR